MKDFLVFLVRSMKAKCTLILLFLPMGFLFSAATIAIWKPTVAGNLWSNNANWQGSVAPTMAGDSATFNNIGAGGTVNLNVTEMVATINFDSGTSYTIASTGGNLNLINSPATSPALINITVANGAAVHTISSNISLGSPLTISQGSSSDFIISGSMSGAQVLTTTATGTGRIVLSAGGGGNSYSLGTAIASGVLSVSNQNQLGTGNVTIGSGTLQFTASTVPTQSLLLSGSSIIDTNGAGTVVTFNSSTVNLSGTGSLTKVGDGTLTLTGSNVNSYSSGTTISAGTLSITNDNQLGASTGSLTLGTATLATAAAITSGRSGSITGSPSTINTMGFTDTLAGNFGGGGSLTVSGGGILNLTGTNTYSGGTTVAATTLQGNTNSLQGTITLNTGPSNLIFVQNFAGTYSGALTSAAAGAGTLSLQGSGAITFTGSSSFSGSTSLSGGSLFVNGSMANSPITVATNTTLGGMGTVGSTTNSGTINPGSGGSAIGNLSINGMLILNPSSNVTINLSPTSASSLTVSTNATIDGALSVNPNPGFYGFHAAYTILTSGGLLNVPAGFTSVTVTSPYFSPTVLYNTPAVGDIQLDIDILRPFAFFPFSNENTSAVGNNLDDLYAAGQLTTDLFNVIQSFTGESNDAINEALDEMHPALFSAFTEMLAATDPLLISLFHRLPYLSCACYNPNRFWVQGFANSLTLKRHGIQIGSQTNTGGIALGLDGEILQNLFLGFGGAWSRSLLEWHDHRGNGEINGFYGSLYSDYQYGAFYIGGAFLAGVDFYETDRHLNFFGLDRNAKAHFRGLDIVGQIQTAYLFGSPSAYFYPYINFDFLYLKTRQFQEHGAEGLNLYVQAHTDSTLRTEMGIGLQVEDSNAADTMSISPSISLGWVNMYPVQREGYHSTFVGSTIPFTTHGWDITWNLLDVDFGLTFTFRCVSVAFDYDVEIAPDQHTIFFNQHGNIRLDFKF